MPPVSIGIVGGGWWAQTFVRIAASLPLHFNISGMVVRRREAGAKLEDKWKVKTYEYRHNIYIQHMYNQSNCLHVPVLCSRVGVRSIRTRTALTFDTALHFSNDVYADLHTHGYGIDKHHAVDVDLRYRSINDMMNAITPEFVVIAVPQTSNAEVLSQMLSHEDDVPILAQTPAGWTVEELIELHERVTLAGRRVYVLFSLLYAVPMLLSVHVLFFSLHQYVCRASFSIAVG